LPLVLAPLKAVHALLDVFCRGGVLWADAFMGSPEQYEYVYDESL